MSNDERAPLTAEELAREAVTALPDKEVISILDLAADIDLAIDGAAPIDLAIALNANVIAPIDAAVGANVLSEDAIAEALADQELTVTQTVNADASATALQDSSIDQSDAVGDDIAGDGAALAAQEVADLAEAGAVEPVDGSVVVNSTGAIIGVLDAATGNVLAPDGTIVGTLNAATGLVVDTAGNLVGTVTSLVDGATLLDAAGNILGTLDAATGNVVNAAGNLVGALNPLTGQVLDAAGNVVGTVADILDDVTDTLAGLDTGDLLEGDLLAVDVNVDLDADLAAPINGAVAANANVAAPIDAAVSANILSDGSQATAIAQQDAVITQSITGDANALSDQVSDIDQASIEPVDADTPAVIPADTPSDTPADAAPDDATP